MGIVNGKLLCLLCFGCAFVGSPVFVRTKRNEQRFGDVANGDDSWFWHAVMSQVSFPRDENGNDIYSNGRQSHHKLQGNNKMTRDLCFLDSPVWYCVLLVGTAAQLRVQSQGRHKNESWRRGSLLFSTLRKFPERDCAAMIRVPIHA